MLTGHQKHPAKVRWAGRRYAPPFMAALVGYHD